MKFVTKCGQSDRIPDAALLQAARLGAAFIACPCCVGKVNVDSFKDGACVILENWVWIVLIGA